MIDTGVGMNFITAICIACRCGFISLAVGGPMVCHGCGSQVRRLATPLDFESFDALSLVERGDLKLAGKNTKEVS